MKHNKNAQVEKSGPLNAIFLITSKFICNPEIRTQPLQKLRFYCFPGVISNEIIFRHIKPIKIDITSKDVTENFWIGISLAPLYSATGQILVFKLYLQFECINFFNYIISSATKHEKNVIRFISEMNICPEIFLFYSANIQMFTYKYSPNIQMFVYVYVWSRGKEEVFRSMRRWREPLFTENEKQTFTITTRIIF